MRICLLMILVTAVFCSFAIAQPNAAERIFKDWDADEDGRLTRAEVPQNQRGNFDKVDTDDDGFVSFEEHSQFLAAIQPKPFQVSDRIELRRDIPYAETENPRQMLDLMLPKDRPQSPVPLIAYIHGGAWMGGDKSAGYRSAHRFAESGKFAVATIGYRLSGEAEWPAQIHDCKAAIRWLKAHADEFGFDPDRVCAMGHSAGGHLVAMLGVTGGDEAMDGDLGEHTDEDSRVTCVIDFFGPSDLLTMGDFPSNLKHNAPDSPESRLVGGPVQENQDKARSAAPMTYVTKDDVPTLILHGTMDMIVPFDQSAIFEEALEDVGVDVTFVRVRGAGHGFDGADIRSRVDDFLAKHLLGEDRAVSDEPIVPAK